MGKLIDAAEVAKHRSSESCWVILYGKVYDVTSFLPEHPGGTSIILSLAGKDATVEYDPVHPPGTLEENLPESACLGEVDPDTLPKHEADKPYNAQNAAPSNSSSSVLRPESHPEDNLPLSALLNLDEIEARATRRMPRKGWAYYWSAADNMRSKLHNHTVYDQILLRPRIFIDCKDCDLSITFLNKYKLSMPVYVSPAAMARLADPSGEKGIAQACAKYNALQIISNNASLKPEQIIEGAPPNQIFGWQLYVQTKVSRSHSELERINKLDAIKFIVLTLDAPVAGKREEDERSSHIAQQLPNSTSSVLSTGEGVAISEGGIGAALFSGTDPTLTWSKTMPWLVSKTSKPIILKGIQTHEDAYLAYRHPDVRGIILSNHGGRAADTAPPSIHTLLEIHKYCPQLLHDDNFEILIDGGIKRGTDVVKALALGAKAVGIGRAALFGLGAGGPAGVERVLEILADETGRAARLLGVQSMAELGSRHINVRRLEGEIWDGPAGVELEGAGSGNGGAGLERAVKGLWSRAKL